MRKGGGAGVSVTKHYRELLVCLLLPMVSIVIVDLGGFVYCWEEAFESFSMHIDWVNLSDQIDCISKC